ncbi:Uncharacterised protein [Achromobacter sp. 2789STDY5608615]|nr:Uncharacterised protein [Achromobacter sp. 2789STDY5608615]
MAASSSVKMPSMPQSSSRRALGVVDGPGGDAVAGGVHGVDQFARGVLLVDVQGDTVVLDQAVEPVGRHLFDQQGARQLGRGVLGCLQGFLGEGRQQRGHGGALPQLAGGQGDGGAGLGLAAGAGLDLDVAGDAVGDGVAGHGGEGGQGFAGVGGGVPAAEVQLRQFAEGLGGGGTVAVGGAVDVVVMHQDEDVVAAELDVVFEHGEAVFGADAHGGEGVLRGQAAAAAVGDVAGIGPGGEGCCHFF